MLWSWSVYSFNKHLVPSLHTGDLSWFQGRCWGNQNSLCPPGATIPSCVSLYLKGENHGSCPACPIRQEWHSTKRALSTVLGTQRPSAHLAMPWKVTWPFFCALVFNSHEQKHHRDASGNFPFFIWKQDTNCNPFCLSKDVEFKNQVDKLNL